MFCEEKIICTYSGAPNYESGFSHFDCYYDMTLYLSSKNREIFETDHFYISVESDDVKLIEKCGSVESIQREGEWIDPHIHIDEDYEDDVPWTDYEATLFTGDRVVSVEQNDKGYAIQFEGFSIQVIHHEPGEYFHLKYIPSHHSYCRVLCTDRLLTRKCSCGGSGELFLDFVSDYGVRCQKCHKSTYANQQAYDAIDEWNNVEELPCHCDFPEETFYDIHNEPVKYIAIHRNYVYYDTNLLDCNSVMVGIGKNIYQIRNRYAGNGKYDFEFEELSNFNPEMWPRRIISTEDEPIKFVRKEDEDSNFAVLRFCIGERPLLITANDVDLMVGISHYDENGDWIEFGKNTMLNDK